MLQNLSDGALAALLIEHCREEDIRAFLAMRNDVRGIPVRVDADDEEASAPTIRAGKCCVVEPEIAADLDEVA